MAYKNIDDPRMRNLTGMRFGHITVLHPTTERQREFIVWACICDCGTQLRIASRNLVQGRSKQSCGCIKPRRAHGEGREYRIWTDIKTRCYNPRSNRFSRYGARGIRLCDRWQDFHKFLEDMGPCPPGMSIDRLNNDGDYEPSNCRWASNREQQRNNSRNRWLTLNGRRMCLIDWATETGISADLIYARIRMGWSVERALTTPTRPNRRQHVTSS